MDEAVVILSDIEAFLRSQKMAESTFGRKAVNDGKLVSRLRGGRAISTATLRKIREFLASQSEAAA